MATHWPCSNSLPQSTVSVFSPLHMFLSFLPKSPIEFVPVVNPLISQNVKELWRCINILFLCNEYQMTKLRVVCCFVNDKCWSCGFTLVPLFYMCSYIGYGLYNVLSDVHSIVRSALGSKGLRICYLEPRPLPSLNAFNGLLLPPFLLRPRAPL